MKNIVIIDDYHEPDFKPSDLIKEYLSLVEKDIGTYFLEQERLHPIDCPGCGNNTIGSEFLKFGLTYVECANCHTLRISPRPDEDSVHRYFTDSAARKFWREELSKSTRKKRKEKIVKPRYEWIMDSCREYLPAAENILDVNTNQEASLEELASISNFNRKILLNPFLDTSAIALKDIEIINTPIQDLTIEKEIDAITLFEVIDRTADVNQLFTAIRRMLKDGGLCFLTAILSSGFDLQVLWNQAGHLIPPDRMNVFSVEGFTTLFERHGFKCLEFSTPGILDVEIVSKTIEEDVNIEIPRFFKYLISKRSLETKQAFQQFLEANQLSSYGRILLRKE